MDATTEWEPFFMNCFSVGYGLLTVNDSQKAQKVYKKSIEFIACRKQLAQLNVYCHNFWERNKFITQVRIVSIFRYLTATKKIPDTTAMFSRRKASWCYLFGPLFIAFYGLISVIFVFMTGVERGVMCHECSDTFKADINKSLYSGPVEHHETWWALRTP